MTAPLPDDQVRAMLEERAARVSPDAEREAMTAFRAAVRGAPDGKGGFAVIPQALSSRDARLPGGFAAVGMVAVVAIALLGGRLSSTNDGGHVGPGRRRLERHHRTCRIACTVGRREPERSGSGSARGRPSPRATSQARSS